MADGPPQRGYAPLELIWTLIPLAIVVALGAYGGIVLNNMTKLPPPQTELEVDVLAFRFGWQFTYPQYGGIQSFDLELQVNRPVLFKIQSKDVVHSFWVQQLGPKQDAVPGLTTELRLTPTQVGQYQVQCSQLCGYGHTYMTAPVQVASAGDFQKWVQQQKAPTPTPAPPGKAVTINLVAQNIAFNLSIITIPAGATVTINFDNKDSIPHNFAVYTDSSAQTLVFRGDIITGPATTTYTFTAPTKPGIYFFRCDVHPTIMTGSFIVQ
jgi:heme/copper-type cytochrome/quinol oxidase subunit 2